MRVSTLDQRTSMLNRHVVPTLGGLACTALEQHHIVRLLEQKAAELAPASLQALQRNLHATLRWARGRPNMLAPAPWPVATTGLPLPRYTPPVHRHDDPVQSWTVENLQVLLAHCLEHTHGVAAALMAGAGLRRGEVVGLQWADVDLDASSLQVRRTVVVSNGAAIRQDGGKTPAAVRTVVLLPELVDALRSLRATQAERLGTDLDGTRPVVCWERRCQSSLPGSPIHPDRLTATYVPGVLEALGLPVVNPHRLRDVYGSLAARAVVPEWGWPLPPEVHRHVLGHSTADGARTHYTVLAHAAAATSSWAAARR